MISLNLQLDEPLQPLTRVATESPFFAEARQPDLNAITENLSIGLGNRYEVLSPLAIGGMSSVLQLRHRLHGGLFVAKVLHAWLAETPAFVGRFRAEAIHSVALAGHPHVASVLDLGEVDGLMYLVMPYIEGEDLDCILQRTKTLDRVEALTLLEHMTSVLLAAERHGIVHADISTGNIRLDSYGLYRLMDFGLSRKRGNDVALWQKDARTALYASPEQWRGEDLDARSDLYSLGVVFCETLTGVSPFLAEDEAAIRCKHLDGKWLLPLALEEDAELAPLIRSLLAKRREDRPENARALASSLASLGYCVAQPRSRLDGELAAPRTIGQRSRLTQMA